jgi:diacylglycerol kinase family enzyme
VGYGGAEIFGDIPRYTENRLIKYYKGILSQFFGDLGPFFVGTNLAIAGKLLRSLWKRKRRWEIVVDGEPAAEGLYHAMIIVNGDLGKDLPFAKSEPLGSGDFHLFTIRDLGFLKLFSQLKRAFDSSILDDPKRWGFASYRVKNQLKICAHNQALFPVNTDGSTMTCQGSASIEIVDQIRLLSR